MVGPSPKSKEYKDHSDYLMHLNPSIIVSSFKNMVRKRLKVSSEQTIDFFVNKSMVPPLMNVSEIYDKFQDEDGFVYITYVEHSPF